MPIDALSVLCAQLTCDLLAIAKFLFFPQEMPLRLSRNMLHGWKDNSMLAKPIAACSYLSSNVSDALVNAQVQTSRFLPHFGFPWGRPWGNHAKCCMDGK